LVRLRIEAGNTRSTLVRFKHRKSACAVAGAQAVRPQLAV